MKSKKQKSKKKSYKDNKEYKEKLESYKKFYTRFNYRIKHIVKEKEIVAYKYITLKEYFLWLLKILVENWQLAWLTLAIIIIVIYITNTLSTVNDPRLIIMPYFSTFIILLVLIIFRKKVNSFFKKKYNITLFPDEFNIKSFFSIFRKFKFLTSIPITYNYAIFSKKWIFFNKSFYKYNSYELKDIISYNSKLLNETLLYPNKTLEILKKEEEENKGNIIYLIFLITAITLLINISNPGTRSLIFIVISILYRIYISRKNEEAAIFALLIVIILGATGIVTAIMIILLGVLPFLTPIIIIFYVIISIRLQKLNKEKYYSISYVLTFLLFLSIIITSRITAIKSNLNFEIFKIHYIALLIVFLLIEIFNTPFIKYIFSVPIVILSLIPILIYSSLIYLKQKLFPSTNEKIYFTLLTLWQNIQNINNLTNQIIKWLDDFLNWKIFSVDKIIERNFKKISKLISINKNLIDNSLIPLIQNNKILKDNIDINNLYNYHKQKLKEIINKLLLLLNDYISKVSQQITQIKHTKNSNNIYNGHLLLRESELNLLHNNLITQKNYLLKIKNLID